jgi:hypothetical protein
MCQVSLSNPFHLGFSFSLQSWVDEKTPWTTRYGSIAGLAELGHDVSLQEELGEGQLHLV